MTISSALRVLISVAVFLALPVTWMARSVSASQAGDNILITEVMPDAVQSGVDNEFEWAELYNPTASTIDISGWQIVDGAGNDYVFNSATDDTQILSGGYLLLVLDATDTPPNGKTDTNDKSFEVGYGPVLSSLPAGSGYVDLVDAIKLNNGGDFLSLCSSICSGSNQVDYVEWEDFSGAGLWNDDAGADSGMAICRSGIIDSDSESDWQVTPCNPLPTGQNNGTPGTGSYGVFSVVITESGGSTEATEGQVDDIGVNLGASPGVGETVTVSVTSGDQCQVLPSSLTFDDSNWSVIQQLSVSAVDDSVDEPSPLSCPVSFSASSSDSVSPFNGLAISDVDAQIIDNDEAGIAVGPSTELTVAEGGSTESINLKLQSQPAADVTLTCSTTSANGSEITMDPSVFVFTPANFGVSQQLIIAAVDDDGVEPSQQTNVSCTSSSDDGYYEGLISPDVLVNILDNDEAAAQPADGDEVPLAETGDDPSSVTPTTGATGQLAETGVESGVLFLAALVGSLVVATSLKFALPGLAR